jgi:WD40 repeat protein
MTRQRRTQPNTPARASYADASTAHGGGLHQLLHPRFTNREFPFLKEEDHLSITPADHARDLPPLIPREVLFGNPERIQPSVSPDGTRLAWVAPRDGVLNLWVADLDDLDATTRHQRLRMDRRRHPPDVRPGPGRQHELPALLRQRADR